MSSSLGLFFVGAALLIVSPGPDFAYVMTQGVARGRRTGVLSALGIGGGLLCHTLLAALGLTALLMASPLAFDAAKTAGAAYLVYLGVQSLRSRGVLSKLEPAAAGREDVSRIRIVRQGLLTNLLNPKAVLTFMAFIPQFISAESDRLPQIVFLGVSMAVLGAAWFGLVGYFAGMIGERLSKPRYARLVNGVTGCVLVGLGVRLAVLAH